MAGGTDWREILHSESAGNLPGRCLTPEMCPKLLKAASQGDPSGASGASLPNTMQISGPETPSGVANVYEK